LTRGDLQNPDKSASCSAADRDKQPSGARRLHESPFRWQLLPWRALLFLLLTGLPLLAMYNFHFTSTSRSALRRIEATGNEGYADIGNPGPDQLNVWFASNQERFRHAPHISFRHLYFSNSARGPRARDIAVQVLRSVSYEADSPAANLADSSMFSHYYEHRTRQEVARVFGPKFTQSLFEQPPGSWRGPIESELGWHLVWIDSVEPGRVLHSTRSKRKSG